MARCPLPLAITLVPLASPGIVVPPPWMGGVGDTGRPVVRAPAHPAPALVHRAGGKRCGGTGVPPLATDGLWSGGGPQPPPSPASVPASPSAGGGVVPASVGAGIPTPSCP